MAEAWTLSHRGNGAEKLENGNFAILGLFSASFSHFRLEARNGLHKAARIASFVTPLATSLCEGQVVSTFVWGVWCHTYVLLLPIASLRSSSVPFGDAACNARWWVVPQLVVDAQAMA